MTIETTRTNEYTIGQVVTLAYRRAGLISEYQQIDAQQTAAGQMELQLICDGLENRGITARATEFYTFDVTAGTEAYPLPSYCLNVTPTAMWIVGGQSTPASSELPLRRYSQEEWQTIVNKATSGTPNAYFHERDVLPNQIRLWPIPAADGAVRVQLQRLRADVQNGTKTLDFERYWFQGIVYKLAGQLAINGSLIEKGTTLLGLGEKEIEQSLGLARDQGSYQYRVPASRWRR